MERDAESETARVVVARRIRLGSERADLCPTERRKIMPLSPTKGDCARLCSPTCNVPGCTHMPMLEDRRIGVIETIIRARAINLRWQEALLPAEMARLRLKAMEFLSSR